jgi:hypothetical protein
MQNEIQGASLLHNTAEIISIQYKVVSEDET